MNRDGSNEPQPIIIVRRRRMEDEGHHGGAWKIAFADFMTAMMALFLVLWLVNASDDDTRKAVASYFNPVKLVDRESSRRGLNSSADGAKEEEQVSGSADEKQTPVLADEAAGSGREEVRFLAMPDAVLDEREAQALSAGSSLGSRAPTDVSLASDLRPADPYALDETRKAAVPSLPVSTPEDTIVPEPEPASPSEGTPLPDVKPRVEPATEDEAKQVAADVRTAILEALPHDTTLVAAVKVTQVEGGTLIQLTDGPGYAMFDSGSFVPTGRTVIAVKAIAAALKGRAGGVRIEGHTDPVPFTGDGDNWRLSTERAHAARQMLARGGLHPSRLRQVTGFAASRPLDRAEPDARNRRIEIMLERS